MNKETQSLIWKLKYQRETKMCLKNYLILQFCSLLGSSLYVMIGGSLHVMTKGLEVTTCS